MSGSKKNNFKWHVKGLSSSSSFSSASSIGAHEGASFPPPDECPGYPMSSSLGNRQDEPLASPPGRHVSPGHREFSKSNTWAEMSYSSSSGPLEKGEPASANSSKRRGAPQYHRQSTLPPMSAAASEIMQRKMGSAAKTEQLQGTLAAHRKVTQRLRREDQGRMEAEAQKAQALEEAAELQKELERKCALLEQQGGLLHSLYSQVGPTQAKLIQDFMEHCEKELSGEGAKAADVAATGGRHVAIVSALEKENALYLEDIHRLRGEVEDIHRLRGEVEFLRADRVDMGEQIDVLQGELEAARKEQGKDGKESPSDKDGSPCHEDGTSGYTGRNGALEKERTQLRRELQEAKEDKEATVTALMGQVMTLEAKLSKARKEREAAVQDSERRMEVVERELAILVEKHERSQEEVERARSRNQEEAERARASRGQSEEYLRALDIARVEIKRLRIERDLMTERLNQADEALRQKGGLGGDLAAWLMPDCLLQQHSQGRQATAIKRMSYR